jgi:hypothetical protein
MASNPNEFQRAMEALNREMSKQVLEPGYKASLPADLRQVLVDHSERTFSRTEVDPESVNRVLMQRLAARTVAASLGMLDGAVGKNPFKNAELARIYESEKHWLLMHGRNDRTEQNGLSH